jgi:putative tryptophan/tyrosine transport system substrate-binding protein
VQLLAFGPECLLVLQRLIIAEAVMKRREFIALLGGMAMAVPRDAIAQTATKVYRIALISPGGLQADSTPNARFLLGALAQLGYTPGQNLAFEGPRGTPGQSVPLPQLMQELKAGKVDVIVVFGYPAAIAAKASGIPTVVAFGAGDPVATGLVENLARPSGNITGISDIATTLSTKRLGLLQQLLPKLKRVAMLWNKDDLGMSLRYDASAKAAEALGVDVQPVGVREPEDFNEAFAAMDREPPDAILMVSDSLTILNRKRVFEYAATHKLPAIYEYDPLVREGGLMSYGPDLRESFERAASMVDRILKGAKPSDLPFEQPTRYLFVINLKTAKSIGLEIPPTLSALADEVIE